MFKSRYPTEKKLEVILEGLRGSGSIAELARRHGISDALYYRWRDQFLEGGRKALEQGRGPVPKELEEKLSSYERLIGKLTVQNEVLKKTFPNLNGRIG